MSKTSFNLTLNTDPFLLSS